MAEFKAKSFAGQIQLLMEIQQDFSQRLKKRLIFESSKVANPFKFIVGLITKGVLCDGSDESEGSFGLKETIVQLALMLACSKDASAIGGLMESLDESGNSDLVSSLETWIKEDFGIEIKDSLSEPKGSEANMQTPTSGVVVKRGENSCVIGSSGTYLIDKIMSRLEDDFMEQFEGHLVGQASKIVNAPEFCSSLANENLLDEGDIEMTNEPQVQGTQRTEKAIKAASSKRTIGSLILALQRSNNERILNETYEWLGTSPARKKNYPIAVKSLADQRSKEQRNPETSTLFEQPALQDGLTKLATLKFQEKSATKAISALQFDKERMIALSADGTLNLWNLRGGEEESIQIAVNVKNITCFQYDEEILILGTSQGTVHLFDARTFEDKSTIYVTPQVTSLKFVESTLVVFTREDREEELWWVDISRPDMQLLNHRELNGWWGREDRAPGVCMYPDISFLYFNAMIFVYDTKSGNRMTEENGLRPIRAPHDISKLMVGDLFSTKRVLVAGCTSGTIEIWNTSKMMHNQNLSGKTFWGHKGAIVSLCVVSGHLLSLDKTGMLLMWYGYDLESLPIASPMKLVVAENFSNVSNLAAYEQWFASGPSEDGTVNIWTLPDLWLRAL